MRSDFSEYMQSPQRVLGHNHFSNGLVGWYYSSMRAKSAALVLRCKCFVSCQVEEVSIDSLTTVPADLYDNFLRAGLRAKARGQHRLQATLL
eukprot:4265929-Amphidinium_carterae.1